MTQKKVNCTHKKVRFESNGFRIVCAHCDRNWVALMDSNGYSIDFGYVGGVMPRNDTERSSSAQ